ncbi:MAG: PAS domain S-box protein, partial [Candidatus Jordarchaeaceae archaeon]
IENICKECFDGILTIDPEGNITFASLTSNKLFGYDSKELIGNPFQNYLPKSELQKIIHAYHEVLRGKTIEHLQFELQRKDDSRALVEISFSPIFRDGKVVEILGVAKDITKQKLSNMINYQTDLLQKVFNSITDAVFILDTDFPPNIVECNEAASIIFGYKKSEMLNKNMEFLHIRDKDFEELQSSIISVIEGSKPNFRLSLLMRRKDGSIFPVDYMVSRLQDKDGKQIGLISFIRDLSKKKTLKEDSKTAKKKSRLSQLLNDALLRESLALGSVTYSNISEELSMTKEKLKEYAEHLEELVEERTRELRETQEKLLKAERLAAIGELAAMVGHDLRNPLTSIVGAVYILRKTLNLEKDEKIRTLLKTIEESVKYSNKIVTELLEYSREIVLELTETSPNQILRDTLDLVKIPENIRLVDFTLDEPKIMVDGEKLQRVFINIVQNAIDAMPEGGELTIRSWVEGGELKISFTDTGVGISVENMGKIFRPLFTTKSKGIGLGLPICKRIVEAHNGSISVESVEGRGSTFTITLPLNKAKH